MRGTIRTSIDVRHVVEVKQNPISLSTLDSMGYRYTSECGLLNVSQGFLSVMKGHKSFT